MKNSRIINLFIIGLMCIAASGCRSSKSISSTYANTTFETSVLNVNQDGTLTVRAWGTGASKAIAIEQAKKNAVYDVIFKGFRTGNSYHYTALVTEVNARERYQEYFDRFFAEGGEYLYYVAESSNSDNSRISSKSDSRQAYSVIVDVYRTGLQSQLIKDGILAR